jgi:glycosyltransferase involved in cell wall biosynthesis
VGGEKRSDVDYDAYVRSCRAGQKIIVTGRLADGEVAAALRRSDLFVFPTLADTFPLVVLEAMAHGVPVLASRVGGIPHQLDEECGVLVEPRDAAGLAAAVDRLADQPERLQAMGRHARARAAQQFTWAKAAEDAAAGYRRILQAQSRVNLAPFANRQAGYSAIGH